MDHTDVSQVPLWAAPTPEEEDLDEPPELKMHHPAPQNFQRTAVRRNAEQPSLLTQAFRQKDDGDPHDLHEPPRSILANNHRRRSMASNISIASTADLTSDTGLTSPSRTNTPSPPIPDMAMLRLTGEVSVSKDGGFPFNTAAAAVPGSQPADSPAPQEPAKESVPRKRCIQFACAAKPITPQEAPATATPMVKAPSDQDRARKPCIRFACPPRPASTQNTPPSRVPQIAVQSPPPTSRRAESPSTPKKTSALSAAAATSPSRPHATRRLSNKTSTARPKFLRANSKDLVKDSSQFHEFASGVSREDDWIRDKTTVRARLTINDTLTKENDFRRLANEAEAEAEMEEEGEDEDDSDDSSDEDEDEEDFDEDEDAEDEEDDEFDDSDGYYTDEETGFADSDESDDEDENMVLWTPSHATVTPNSNATVVPQRRSSLQDPLSDSASEQTRGSIQRVKPRRIKTADDEHTHDLPDSTDFVCGTLDEDRPLEEAYLSCLAARRNEKLRIIPQDIDPSFPTSDPENEEQERYNPVHHESDDEDHWLQGKMEDLHHADDRSRRRRRSEQPSPRKYHSPPPKRHLSPGRKTRGRSPKPLFGRHSPRRMRSPAPRAMTTPTQSPRQGANVNFHLAGRPDVMHTKSLPRPAAMFRMKSGRFPKRQDDDVHVRGAVDIVKGLEKKRQRRKEKFYQKYCNRARRGQIPERKPQPGRGAERMKELGLLMAGKKDPGNYVLSV